MWRIRLSFRKCSRPWWFNNWRIIDQGCRIYKKMAEVFEKRRLAVNWQHSWNFIKPKPTGKLILTPKIKFLVISNPRWCQVQSLNCTTFLLHGKWSKNGGIFVNETILHESNLSVLHVTRHAFIETNGNFRYNEPCEFILYILFQGSWPKYCHKNGNMLLS